MKTNEKNISLKEALQLNHRAYKLFYRYYPKLILSQISLTKFVYRKGEGRNVSE